MLLPTAMGLLHSVHLTSRDSDCFCSGIPFFSEIFLYSEQPWNVERVLLSGLLLALQDSDDVSLWNMVRHTYCPIQKVQVFHLQSSSPVMEPIACAVVIQLSSYHPVGIGVQRTNINMLIFMLFALA